MERKSVNLTNEPQTPYSKGGDIFMEGKPDMPPANLQPTNPEHAERPFERQVRPTSAETRAAAREFLKRPNLPLALRKAAEQIATEGKTIGGAQDIDRTGITDPLILKEIDVVDDSIDIGLPPLSVLVKSLENINRLTGVDSTQQQNARDRIKTAIAEAKRAEEGRQRQPMSEEEEQERRFSLYLTSKDLNGLRKDPMEWLDGKFDILYKFAEQGEELTSPIINSVQSLVTQAIEFVQNYKPEVLDPFQRQFTTRFHLIQNRVVIGHKSMEQIGETARQLGVNGLFYAMGMENGRVGSMFNRFNELLEDERLALNKQHHVTPELAYKLQRFLIEEQMDLAKKGVSSFGDLKDIPAKAAGDQNPNDPDTWDDFVWATKTDRQIKDKKMPDERIERIMRIKRVNADITRSVRTAYDVFVCSQRMGVIVARGRRLKGDEAYFSDPIGAFNIYNIEDLLWNKFDMYTSEQHEFVNRLKLAMAEDKIKDRRSYDKLSEQEKLDLGRRLFRDIYLIPDFFTSGWRIRGITDSIQERFNSLSLDTLQRGISLNQLLSVDELAKFQQINSNEEKTAFLAKKRAEDFALFMRLKYSGKDDDKLIDTREIWRKIAKYRPDEIIRIFRERADGELGDLYQKMGGIDSSLRTNPEEEKKGITTYDKFKKTYGGALRLLREKALGNGNSKDMPFQLDVSRINSDPTLGEYKALINAALGERGAERLANLFKIMQEDIGIRDRNGNDIAYSAEHNQEYKNLSDRLTAVKKEIEDVERKWENQKTVDLEEKEKLEEQKKNIADEIARFEKDSFHDKINLLLTDQRFEDVYKRTLLVDDALLGELEEDHFRGNLGKDGKPFTKLSAKFSTDKEGDSLKRSWNDHANAQKAATGLLQFIISDDPQKKIEGAREFAMRTSDYNGLSARVDCIRYTIGTLLDLSKKDYVWDLLAFEKGLFRSPISEMQRIMGVQAKAFSRDEARHELDELRTMLTGSLSKEDAETYQKLSPRDRIALREKKKKTYIDLERILEVAAKDKLKMSALTFLMYLLLAVGGEGVKILQEAGKDMAKSS